MSKKSRRRSTTKKGLPPGSLVYTGHWKALTSHVTSVWYQSDDTFEQIPAYAPELRKRKGGITWIDIQGLTDTALISKVGEDNQIHPLALEDILDTQQRAKLEEFDNGLFFILHHIKVDCASLEFHSEQIALFVGKDYLISFQEDPDDTFVPVRKRAEEGIGRIRKKGTDYLAYALIDLVVDSYYSVLDDLEGQLLELEENLHQKGVLQADKSRMFSLKRTVNDFRHRLLPLREAVTRLHRTEGEWVEDSTRLYIRDLVDHVAQILDGIDNQRDMISNLEALYQAEASNRLNNVMRLLTVISTIFIPLSFIAGVYGMNFDNMPELHWHYGYFTILGAMFIAMVGMLIFFRKKQWI